MEVEPKAQTVIDSNGSVVDIYMISPGEGYCPSTNVVPPKYPVTEGSASVLPWNRCRWN